MRENLFWSKKIKINDNICENVLLNKDLFVHLPLFLSQVVELIMVYILKEMNGNLVNVI